MTVKNFYDTGPLFEWCLKAKFTLAKLTIACHNNDGPTRLGRLGRLATNGMGFIWVVSHYAVTLGSRGKNSAVGFSMEQCILDNNAGKQQS